MAGGVGWHLTTNPNFLMFVILHIDVLVTGQHDALRPRLQQPHLNYHSKLMDTMISFRSFEVLQQRRCQILTKWLPGLMTPDMRISYRQFYV